MLVNLEGADSRRSHVNSTAAQEEHGDERSGVVEAEGSTSDHPGLAVEPLDGPVVQPSLDVGEDAVSVFSDGPSQLHEGRELGARRPRQPLGELARGDVDLATVQDGDQRLLEQVGPVQPRVDPLDHRDLVALEAVQVPRVLLERPAGLLEPGLVLGHGVADLVAADLVESIVGETLDVESIEDELGLRRGIGDGLDVRARHVDGHRLELGAALGPQGLEEAPEGLGALALGGPDDLAALVVDDDGDVLMVPPVAQLVDPDEPQAVELVATLLSMPADDPTDDAPDGHPGDPHQARDRGSIGALGEVGDLALCREGEAAASLGPRDLLDLDPAARALDAPHHVAQLELDAGQVQVPPPSLPTSVDAMDLATAIATAGDPPGRLDVDHEPLVLEVEGGHEGALEGKKDSEYTCWAHRAGGWFRSFGDCESSPSRARFLAPPNLLGTAASSLYTAVSLAS